MPSRSALGRGPASLGLVLLGSMRVERDFHYQDRDSLPLDGVAFDEPRLHLSLIWDRRRFADGSVQRILDQLRAALIEFAGKLSAQLAALDLGRAAEADIVAGWNLTRSGYAAEAAIPALFAAQVARDPDATAVVFGTGSVTYAELDRRSNALAWLLRRRGVGAAARAVRASGIAKARIAIVNAGSGSLDRRRASRRDKNESISVTIPARDLQAAPGSRTGNLACPRAPFDWGD